MGMTYIPLPDRAIITIKGHDRVSYLQSLVSNDVEKSGKNKAIWAAILTPQGKYLFDFFITTVDDQLWLDCEKSRMMDLGRLLHKYKLHADIELGIGENLKIYAIFDSDEYFDGNKFNFTAIYDDPRLIIMGKRAILSNNDLKIFTNLNIRQATIGDYDQRRIINGLPDGSNDMQLEKALLLENGFDELSGIDWQKGCFIGQEITARMKYRGLVKKRLLSVIFDGEPPKSGTNITMNGKNIGEVKSVNNNNGLALVYIANINNLNDYNFIAGNSRVELNIASWLDIYNL